jgi:thymidylate synthase
MSSPVDDTYSKLLKTVLYGTKASTRNGITKMSFGLTASFDYFPLVHLRRTAWKLALREMEWFLSGSTNIKGLHESLHHWWEPWADNCGEIDFSYGKQFRDFSAGPNGYDQLQGFISGLKDDPYSRRHVMTTWNSYEMQIAPISNCHGTVVQAIVQEKQDLNLIMYQRSADMLLGVPHNWVQYWAFGKYLEYLTGYKFKKLVWFGGDCHIYEKHVDVAKKMVKFPTEKIENMSNLRYYGQFKNGKFKADDFRLSSFDNNGYKPIFVDKLEMVV